MFSIHTNSISYVFINLEFINDVGDQLIERIRTLGTLQTTPLKETELSSEGREALLDLIKSLPKVASSCG